MVERMTQDKALECFGGGLDCSQVVFGYGAELLGEDKEKAVKIAAAFGGGMWNGETCGCVTGALMALGLKYGHCKLGDEETKNALLLKRKFWQRPPSTSARAYIILSCGPPSFTTWKSCLEL